MTQLRATAVVLLGWVAGCTYDFVVGPPRDASAPQDAEPDAGVDAAPPSCAELELGLKRAREAVTRCEQATECIGTVKDECDCPTPVPNDTGDAALAYVREVESFKAASCAKCTKCPDRTDMMPVCKPNAAGSQPHCEWF